MEWFKTAFQFVERMQRFSSSISCFLKTIFPYKEPWYWQWHQFIWIIRWLLPCVSRCGLKRWCAGPKSIWAISLSQSTNAGCVQQRIWTDWGKKEKCLCSRIWAEPKSHQETLRWKMDFCYQSDESPIIFRCVHTSLYEGLSFRQSVRQSITRLFFVFFSCGNQVKLCRDY